MKKETSGLHPIRPLQLLDAFRIAKEPLGLSEMAQLSHIPVSTCHGVVKALERHGYLYWLSSRKAYPTRRLWDIASVIEANDPIARALMPALVRLRDATGETVVLGARQEDAVRYLLVVESEQTIRFSAPAGRRVPLHASAIGKTALGSMSADDLRDWLTDADLVPLGLKTITDRETLRKELENSRQAGYYATRGEHIPDVMAIAVPLRMGSLNLGIAVCGPIHRMQPAESTLASMLIQHTQHLALSLGEGGHA